MSCNCKRKPHTVDVTCLEPTSWDETEFLIGIEDGHIVKTEKADFNGLTDRVDDLSDRMEMAESDIGQLDSRITAGREAIDDLDERTTQNEQDVASLYDTADRLDQRVTTNEQAIGGIKTDITGIRQDVQANRNDITANAADIQSILDELAASEHFKGYFADADQIARIENPHTGDFAWNAQTGTVWKYNGAQWTDSGVEIPDQTVEASTLLPLMDGEGSAGVSNQYARGDHRHPADSSKQDVLVAGENITIEGITINSTVPGDVVRQDDLQKAVQQVEQQIEQAVEGVEAELDYYLPLTGGTLTGTLVQQSNQTQYSSENGIYFRAMDSTGYFVFAPEGGAATAEGNYILNASYFRPGTAGTKSIGHPTLPFRSVYANNLYKQGVAVATVEDTAAVEEKLGDYLPLEGGTLTGALETGGDITIPVGAFIKLGPAGNHVIYYSSNNGMQLITSGARGINLLTENGTVKYNGIEIATVDDTAALEARIAALEAQLAQR